MKNTTLISELSKYEKNSNVSIRANLQYGVIERGFGKGEYNGLEFSQDYKTEWNDGYLEVNEFGGITVEDVIDVLSSKLLSEISNTDFNLSLGELSTGYSEYETKWEGGEPDDNPDDSELYMLMDVVESEYEWEGPISIEFLIHDESIGNDEVHEFVLSEDDMNSNETLNNTPFVGNTALSTQEQLFDFIKDQYPNSVAKKINKDNYLDIYIPEINSKRGTHLFFNTVKDIIKIGFYCRDEEFIDNCLANSSSLEKYSQGIRIIDNPAFTNVEDACSNAMSFISNLLGEEELEYDEEDEYGFDMSNYDIEDEVIIKKAIEKIEGHQALPFLPYINQTFEEKGIEVEKHPAFFFVSNVYVGEIEPTAYLYVNMDGFYSDCTEEKFRCIFSWESVTDLEIIEEDESGIKINIVSKEGVLTLHEPFTKSFHILIQIYRSAWKKINETFANSPMISWNEVDSMGINLLSFDTHEDYLKWLKSE
jgi:hypothetical protein